jgi:hypothetical protein
MGSWLTRQRELLGEVRFLELLREQLNEEEVKVLLKLVEDYSAQQ